MGHTAYGGVRDFHVMLTPNVRRHTKQPHNAKQRVNLTHGVVRYLTVQPRMNNDSLPAAAALETAGKYRDMRN